MRTLEDYLYQYDALSAIDTVLDDPINEGKIMNGIKKIWNWIIKRNKKNKDTANVSRLSADSDSYDSDDNEATDIKFEQYSLEKFKQAISGKKDKLNDAINVKIKKNKDKNSKNIKVLLAKYADNILGILVYINPAESPYSNISTFTDYAHIYSLYVEDENEFKTIAKKLFNKLTNILTSDQHTNLQGFTMTVNDDNKKQVIDGLKFKEYNDKNLKLLYYTKK